MDNTTRLQYLKAMEVDVWVSRNTRSAEEPETQVELGNQENERVVNLSEPLAEKWLLLEKEVSECKKCSLSSTRTQTVFASGSINSEWMLIGEALGQNEDLEGQPFVGNAGKLLTEMIRAIGLAREQVYICNIIKCRPPNNRNPKTEEVNSCDDYLQRQIALVNPKIILAIGRIAAQTLLKTSEPLAKLRGVSHQLAGVPLVVVYHPAYLLRSLLEKRKAWQDLQLAMKVYQENK